MSDTTTDTSATGDEQPARSGPDVPADEPIAISTTIGGGQHNPVKDRLLLPLLVPVLSAIVVGMLAVNISRIFLASDTDAALVSGIVITLAILGVASLLAAAPRMHTSSLAVVTGLIVVIVVSGGLLTLGPSLDSGEGGETGYVEPPGPATSTVAIEAGPGLTFDGVAFDSNFPATAGVVEIDYGGDAGHTLVFRDPEFDGFLLASPPAKPQTGKVELKAGTYQIYCTIGTHAAQGMEATITVAAA